MIEATEGGVRLHLFVQPKASRNEIIGPHNGEIKIKISAPPVDGKANQELIEFLSEELGVPKRSITVIGGETQRHKKVEIQGVTAEQVKNRMKVTD